jgi:N-acetylneuraminic acid mutarotase
MTCLPGDWGHLLQPVPILYQVTEPLSLTLILVSLLAGCGGSNAPTYSVSASVSGLSGSGLQLQLNSGTTVQVGTGSSVAFPNRLGGGASYQVKVVSQPQNPAQTCLVSNGSGTIGAADVSNVSISCAFGIWTWVAGSDQASEINDSAPASRRGAIGWSDHLGHFWLSGGVDLDDRGMLADFWEFDVSTGQWTTVSSNITPGGRGSSATWVDSSNRLWLFGGDGPSAVVVQDLMNDLWVYDPTAQSWTLVNGPSTSNGAGTYGTQGVAAAGNVPGARAGAAYWIDGSDNLWLFGGGGMDASGNVGALADLWRFDPTSGQWAWITGSQTANAGGNYGVQGVASATNAPPARTGATAWIDSSGALWLFGGAGSTSYFGDVWKFDTVAGQWTWVSGSSSPDNTGNYGSIGVIAASNAPGARTGADFWTDPSGRFWMFGGFGYDSTGTFVEMNDMWVFSPSTGEWTWVNGPSTGNLPGNYWTLNVPALTNIPWAPGSSVHWQDSSGNLYLFGDSDNRAVWQFAPAQ